MEDTNKKERDVFPAEALFDCVYDTAVIANMHAAVIIAKYFQNLVGSCFIMATIVFTILALIGSVVPAVPITIFLIYLFITSVSINCTKRMWKQFDEMLEANGYRDDGDDSEN